jgi:hypothetical protein
VLRAHAFRSGNAGMHSRLSMNCCMTTDRTELMISMLCETQRRNAIAYLCQRRSQPAVASSVRPGGLHRARYADGMVLGVQKA